MMSCPPMRAVPSLGSRIPQSIRITVDFPEPFGPRNPKIDPLPTLNVTRSTAVNVPNRLVKPSHSIIAAIVDLALIHIWEINVCRHTGAQTLIIIGQTNLHAKYL